MRKAIRDLAICAAMAASAAAPALAQNSCPLPGQKPMLVTELFFGRSIPSRAPLTEREWRGFAARVLTKNFPDGFTAYDAEGQWRNDGTNAIVREGTKVVVIAADPSTDVAKRIAIVTGAYRKEFHQLSVGIISETECAAF